MAYIERYNMEQGADLSSIPVRKLKRLQGCGSDGSCYMGHITQVIVENFVQ